MQKKKKQYEDIKSYIEKNICEDQTKSYKYLSLSLFDVKHKNSRQMVVNYSIKD